MARAAERKARNDTRTSETPTRLNGRSGRDNHIIRRGPGPGGRVGAARLRQDAGGRRGCPQTAGGGRGLWTKLSPHNPRPCHKPPALIPFQLHKTPSQPPQSLVAQLLRLVRHLLHILCFKCGPYAEGGRSDVTSAEDCPICFEPLGGDAAAASSSSRFSESDWCCSCGHNAHAELRAMEKPRWRKPCRQIYAHGLHGYVGASADSKTPTCDETAPIRSFDRSAGRFGGLSVADGDGISKAFGAPPNIFTANQLYLLTRFLSKTVSIAPEECQGVPFSPICQKPFLLQRPQ